MKTLNLHFDMDLANKKILVTGASSGIGQAIAIAAATKGATVLIHYRKNKVGAHETLAAVKKFSSGAIFQADLTNENQIQKMFDAIAKQNGAIDALVNNAGEVVGGDFFNNAAWHEQFENIFFSAVHTTQQFLQQNRVAKLKKIISVGSIYGNLGTGNADYFAYSTAKAALAQMTVTLAQTNPRVLANLIAPGYTLTPLWDGVSTAIKKSCINKTLIKRFITPEEVAHVAVALLENDAITGQVITIDGGRSPQL